MLAIIPAASGASMQALELANIHMYVQNTGPVGLQCDHRMMQDIMISHHSHTHNNTAMLSDASLDQSEPPSRKHLADRPVPMEMTTPSPHRPAKNPGEILVHAGPPLQDPQTSGGPLLRPRSSPGYRGPAGLRVSGLDQRSGPRRTIMSLVEPEAD